MNILVKSAKIFGIIILTFVITVVAQNVAILWHLLDLKSVETILHGLTYAVITFLLIKWFIQKGLKGAEMHTMSHTITFAALHHIIEGKYRTFTIITPCTRCL